MDGETGPQPSPSGAGLDSARFRGLTADQWPPVLFLLGALAAGLWLDPGLTLAVLVWLGWTFFSCTGVLRAMTAPLSTGRAPEAPPLRRWPRYTVVAPLRGEAEVVRALIARLDAIDYPRHRLQGLIVVEPDDPETVAAAMTARRPAWLQVVVAPPGEPRTKPRALNVALGLATGSLITVYDAEDDPDPLQLKEAAARFAVEAPSLACLQAPLRIRTPRRGRGDAFLHAQFAAEYAALFDVVLPALARLGWPFPLGGTSNHFRVEALRRVGGWDAWNVTEDADLGFRLWRGGYRLGVLNRPTYEPPPADFEQWLPQRTRWLKGHLQTWGVHMRRPWRLGWRGLLALQLTLGQSLAAAAIHAVTAAWLISVLLIWGGTGLNPLAPPPALATLAIGCASAWLLCAIGSARAGLPYPWRTILGAPAYWILQSLALGHAVVRLVRAPFAWDKTHHGLEDIRVHERTPPLDATRASGQSAGDGPRLRHARNARHPALARLRAPRQRRREEA
ncbi:MAG: glycosyltransferase family 2 protein [Brevundimonas sp.]